MGFLNISAYLPKDVIDNISKEMLKLDIGNLEPKLADPSLIQIDGYVHTMKDDDTHLIEKEKPYLTEEDSNFQPLTFSYVDLKAREYELQDLVIEKATNFLRELYGPNFNRLVNLEILGVDDEGNGFEQMWRGYSNNLYLSSGKVWNPKETHVYVMWRASYKLLGKKKNENKEEKLPTIGEESSSSEVQIEDVETRKETGESVMCLPEDCLDKLTVESAIDYLATKALDNLRITPYLEEEVKDSYINGNGVVSWSKNPPFKLDVKSPFDFQTDEAKNSLEKQTKATQEKLKAETEKMHQEYMKMLSDAKGEWAAQREEIKYNFNELKTLCIEVDDITVTFSKKMAELASLAVVTTPTGPGVAINAVATQLGNLKTTATSMKGILGRIENLMNKLKLDMYAPLIPGLNSVYMVIKNLLSLANTAITLVGG